MAQRRSQTLSTAQTTANRTALRALKLLSDYTPLNADFSKDTLAAIDTRLHQAEEHEFQLETALAAARAARAELCATLHDGILGAKAAVLSQYGPNSDQIASLGLKKKNEYRRPTRRNTRAKA